jgi:hypothetical protein
MSDYTRGVLSQPVRQSQLLKQWQEKPRKMLSSHKRVSQGNLKAYLSLNLPSTELSVEINPLVF